MTGTAAGIGAAWDDGRIAFWVIVVFVGACEFRVLFTPSDPIRVAGAKPYIVGRFGAGVPVGQTFRMNADGLASVQLQFSANGPTNMLVRCRLLQWGADAGWMSRHDWIETLDLAAGRTWHRFQFTPLVPSSRMVYQFQVQELEAREGATHSLVGFGLVGSNDNSLKEGNVVEGQTQMVDADLFFEARADDSAFSIFRRNMNPKLSRPLRSRAMQLALLGLYNLALAGYLYRMLVTGPEGDSASGTARSSSGVNRSSLVLRLRRRLLRRRYRCYAAARPLVAGKTGLEIGGPSSMFARGGLLPLYADAGRLDNCNYGRTTVWAGVVEEGLTFTFDRRHEPGRQYIDEATDLRSIPDARYDFVLASHVIEHVANPLRALREWMRVLKDEGVLVLVVPHKDGTFDHRRPITTLDHLIEDEHRGTGEDDLTHLPEILSLHDLTLDPPAGDAAAFEARSLRNVENRCLHHHVFDTSAAVEMVHHVGLQIVAVEPVVPYHIFLIARKGQAGRTPDNGRFRGRGAIYRTHSPFASDRDAHD